MEKMFAYVIKIKIFFHIEDFLHFADSNKNRKGEIIIIL